MANLNTLMDQALVELVKAQDNLIGATNRVAEASRAEVACINRVNEVQKTIDALINTLKKQAPRGTDWRQPVGFVFAEDLPQGTTSDVKPRT